MKDVLLRVDLTEAEHFQAGTTAEQGLRNHCSHRHHDPVMLVVLRSKYLGITPLFMAGMVGTSPRRQSEAVNVSRYGCFRLCVLKTIVETQKHVLLVCFGQKAQTRRGHSREFRVERAQQGLEAFLSCPIRSMPDRCLG